MKYEITSKKEFQIEAAKALLADGQPHSYAEIVQHIRSQAEGTVLEGRIDYGTDLLRRQNITDFACGVPQDQGIIKGICIATTCVSRRWPGRRNWWAE